MPFIIIIGIIVGVIVIIAIAGLRMDREYERGIIFRLGRFKHVKGPGLYPDLHRALAAQGYGR
jgi:regulator of protease activity HflC (stomatin/prohibitin superfamily)